MRREDITDNILRRIRPADRAALGPQVQTAEEATARFVARSEKHLQEEIANLLRLRGIWFDQDAMCKRRTGTKGTPDFLLVVNGYPLALETKFGNGKLSPDQKSAIKQMQRNGWRVYLVRDLQLVKDILDDLTPREGSRLCRAEMTTTNILPKDLE